MAKQGDTSKGKRKKYKKNKQLEGTPAQEEHKDAGSVTIEGTTHTNNITGLLQRNNGTDQRGETTTTGCGETGAPPLQTRKEEHGDKGRAQGGERGVKADAKWN